MPDTDPALRYDSDVTPESLAAVQANSDRFCGDENWEIVDAPDPALLARDALIAAGIDVEPVGEKQY